MTDSNLFTDWLAKHRNGVADVDITEAFRDMCDTAGRIGKPATITLTIKATPRGDMLAVTDSLKVKLPDVVDERLYWVDAGGNLTQRHPLQPSLEDENPGTTHVGAGPDPDPATS